MFGARKGGESGYGGENVKRGLGRIDARLVRPRPRALYVCKRHEMMDVVVGYTKRTKESKGAGEATAQLAVRSQNHVFYAILVWLAASLTLVQCSGIVRRPALSSFSSRIADSKLV